MSDFSRHKQIAEKERKGGQEPHPAPPTLGVYKTLSPSFEVMKGTERMASKSAELDVMAKPLAKQRLT